MTEKMMSICDQTHTKIISAIFSSLEFVSACTKSSHSSDTRESHGIKGHVHLWPNPPKNYCIIISSSEFVSATKISPIHQFSLEIKQILETHNQKSNNHF